MFEDSMMESGGKIKSNANKWVWVTGTFMILSILAIIYLSADLSGGSCRRRR